MPTLDEITEVTLKLWHAIYRHEADEIECAHVRLKGAVTRLALLLQYNSKRNYEIGFRAVEQAIAQYRELMREKG